MDSRQRDRGASRPKEMTVDGLRTMLRGMLAWRDLFDQFGTPIYSVTDQYGTEWSIHEVERLYLLSQSMLTVRQAQAIRYFLVDNMREEDVAIAMGILPSNPIGLYATEGLRRLVEMANQEY